MCEFCKELGIGIPNWDFLDAEKPEFTGMAIEIRQILGEKALVFTNSANEYGFGYIKINYCPMCGRKLVEEKKNPFNVCRDNPNCEIDPEKCGYSVDCTTWGDLAEGKRTYMCGMQNKCPHSNAE